MSGTGSSNQATYRMTTKNRPRDRAIQQVQNCIYRPDMFLLRRFCRQPGWLLQCWSDPNGGVASGLRIKGSSADRSSYLIAISALDGLFTNAFRFARKTAISPVLGCPSILSSCFAVFQHGISTLFQGTSTEEQDTTRRSYPKPL